MSKIIDVVYPVEFVFDLSPAKSKIFAVVTQDGPMSNFGPISKGGPDDVRPDTMVQLRFEVDDYGVYYQGPKQSATPFLGYGDNTDIFLKNIAWSASMWDGESLTPVTRSIILAMIEDILRTRSNRFLPKNIPSPIDQPYGSFVKQGVYYLIGEYKYDGNTVWLKRQIGKDNMITSRWSFVKKHVNVLGDFTTEKKITFTDVTKWDEAPMTFEEAVSQYKAEISSSSFSGID